ncbi:MAG: amidohydrolase family protein, partial [Rhodospirillales bacterium]|nr:amidohydrolase family protein [Rhodospirillales bacterium]
MIVDIHTRVWDSTDQLGPSVMEHLRRARRMPWAVPDGSPEAHRRAMKPVESAVILGFQSDFLGAAISHERVAECVQRDPSKYVGFAGIDPVSEAPLESLEAARKLGLVGVAVSPATQSFHPASTKAMELYEACEQHHMPVFIESGAEIAREAKMEFCQPYLIDEVARSFSNLKLIISSVGHPLVE